MKMVWLIALAMGQLGAGVWAMQDPDSVVTPTSIPEASREELAAEALLMRSMAVLPELQRVTVQVRGATVVIRGEVPQSSTPSMVEALVNATMPQAFVVNQMTVREMGEASLLENKPDETMTADQDQYARERLQAIFKNVPSLKDIEVRVQDGVAHLSGQTLTPEAAQKAEDLAAKMNGVIFVDNGVDVSLQVDRRLAPVIENTLNKLRDLWVSLPLVLIALFIIFVFWFLGRWAMRWEKLYKMVGGQPLVKGIIQQVVFLIFLLVGVILALDLLNARRLVTTLFGAAGLVGLALGFALKDIAENYLASLLLALRRPFTADDYVKIDQFDGTVVRLNMRDTVLMTADGNHLRLPNALVFKSVIINYSRNPMRRFNFDVGIGVDEDLAKVQEIGSQTLRDMKGVSEEPKVLSLVKNLADSSVVVSFYAWVDQAKFSLAKVKSSAIRQVKEALDIAGVDMPSPGYQLDVVTREAAAVESKKVASTREGKPQEEADIQPDHDLERQIEMDRKASGETNLLDESAR